MPWEIVVTIIVAIVVFVLGSLVRASQDSEEKRKTLKRSFEDPERRKRVVTDLDKFLEEARRRRQTQEQRKQPQVIMAEPAPPKPPPKPKRREVEMPLQMPEKRRKPPKPAAQTRREREKLLEVIPVAVEVPRSMPASVLALIPEARPVLAEVAVPTPSQATPTTPLNPLSPRPILGSSVSGPRETPVMAELIALLQSPQRLKAAIALQEILGQPKCKRR